MSTAPYQHEHTSALTRRTPSSYTASDLGSFALWLQHQGYHWIPSPHNPHEAARFMKHGSIVVLFRSGAVLVQGDNKPDTLALLDTYAPTEMEAVL